MTSVDIDLALRPSQTLRHCNALNYLFRQLERKSASVIQHGIVESRVSENVPQGDRALVDDCSTF